MKENLVTVPPIDLIVTGANLHTLANEPSRNNIDSIDTVAVAGGKIAAVGPRADIISLANSNTELLTFEGGTIVPGFTDAHAHPIMSISHPQGADLSGLQTRKEVMQALTRAAAQQKGEWFFASGLDPNAFGEEPITNELLDDTIGPDRLAYVTLFDGHSALVSNSLLQLAGIVEGRNYPDGSMIAAGPDGRPTGHVLEFSAMKAVRAHLPIRSVEERAQDLHTLLTSMAAVGLGQVHVMDLEVEGVFELLTAAEKIGPLPVLLRLSPWCEPVTTDEEVEKLIEMQQRAGKRWKIEGIKLFIDGTIEGGTAWLESPDTKGENTQPFWADQDEYARRLSQFHAAGIPTATHAIGERGIRFAVETIASLPLSDVQHRIEHIESVSKDVIEQLAAAGIAASMQPTHCTHYVRADGSDDWSQRLGPVRAHRAWCTRDVRDAGAILALGSDYPVAPFNPLDIMADAQLRRPAGDPSASPILPEQGLTALQALEGYTTQPEAAIGSPADAGAITIGAPASFTVLDVDPLDSSPDALARGHVLLTVSGGLVVHRTDTESRGN